MTEWFLVDGIVDASGASFLLPHASLLDRSCEPWVLRLTAELFRLLDSRYPPFDLTAGVGLACFAVGRLFRVADTGIRGGGMLSCRAGGCGWEPEPFSGISVELAVLPLDLSLFQVRLSFLLRDDMEDGVAGVAGASGSLPLVCTGVGDLGPGFSSFGGRGPAGFWWARSSRTPVIVA